MVGGSVIFPWSCKILNLEFLLMVGGGSVIYLWPGQIWNLKISVRGGLVNHLFVKVYLKEITTIGEQIFSLYNPTWSHFCSFTFHDVADHLPFFQNKRKLMKYPEKICSLCQDVCQLHTMPQFITGTFTWENGRAIIFCVFHTEKHNSRKVYLGGVGHLSMMRPDLKFKSFVGGGGSIIFLWKCTSRKSQQ